MQLISKLIEYLASLNDGDLVPDGVACGPAVRWPPPGFEGRRYSTDDMELLIDFFGRVTEIVRVRTAELGNSHTPSRPLQFGR